MIVYVYMRLVFSLHLFTGGDLDNVCARLAFDITTPLKFAFASLFDLHTFRCIASPTAHLRTSIWTCKGSKSRKWLLNTIWAVQWKRTKQYYVQRLFATSVLLGSCVPAWKIISLLKLYCLKVEILSYTIWGLITSSVSSAEGTCSGVECAIIWAVFYEDQVISCRRPNMSLRSYLEAKIRQQQQQKIYVCHYWRNIAKMDYS